MQVTVTDTQLEVLDLIARGEHLGHYVPRYRPGARRGRGAFPTTIASRAAAQLRDKGLVEPSSREPYWKLTSLGEEIRDEAVRAKLLP